MTVTLAFKAFAKPIPCLTPFLATSDPSVLKRILAYIWGLPCWSNIFPKKVILTYRPIVAVRLRPDLECSTIDAPMCGSPRPARAKAAAQGEGAAPAHRALPQVGPRTEQC